MTQLTREVSAQLARDLSSTVKTYGHFINGEWVESTSGDTVTKNVVINLDEHGRSTPAI